MKIYVVTSGCYSDYHIDAVFTDRQLADKYAKEDPDRNIEEFEENKAEFSNGQQYYDVWIYPESGDAPAVSLWRGEPKDLIRCMGDDFYELVVKASDYIQAKAIALERFHAFLAVKDTHFPFIETKCVVELMSTLSFCPWYGYFDYKIYLDSKRCNATLLLDYLKVKSPVPFTDDELRHLESKDDIDLVLAALNEHGINIGYLYQE